MEKKRKCVIVFVHFKYEQHKIAVTTVYSIIYILEA